MSWLEHSCPATFAYLFQGFILFSSCALPPFSCNPFLVTEKYSASASTRPWLRFSSKLPRGAKCPCKILYYYWSSWLTSQTCNMCTLVLSGDRRRAARTNIQEERLDNYTGCALIGTREAKIMKGHFRTCMVVCCKCATRKPWTEPGLFYEVNCAKRSSSGMVARDYTVFVIWE